MLARIFPLNPSHHPLCPPKQNNLLTLPLTALGCGKGFCACIRGPNVDQYGCYAAYCDNTYPPGTKLPDCR
ncbi:hypothetical protein Vi05172_g9336 [Venturia inaequalis]|nr:hypothetical protein Vi05172_g9336 [Venturia inaequalis]